VKIIIQWSFLQCAFNQFSCYVIIMNIILV